MFFVEKRIEGYGLILKIILIARTFRYIRLANAATNTQGERAFEIKLTRKWLALSLLSFILKV